MQRTASIILHTIVARISSYGEALWGAWAHGESKCTIAYHRRLVEAHAKSLHREQVLGRDGPVGAIVL